MPRRRPGTIRATRIHEHAWRNAPRRRIAGLSARAACAILRLELSSPHHDVTPGATEQALRQYRKFTHTPGRKPLYPQASDCGCPGCELDDVRRARDILDEVLQRLPPYARRELGQEVAALDARYLARTLPDPFADERRPWNAGAWWYARLS